MSARGDIQAKGTNGAISAVSSPVLPAAGCFRPRSGWFYGHFGAAANGAIFGIGVGGVTAAIPVIPGNNATPSETFSASGDPVPAGDSVKWSGKAEQSADPDTHRKIRQERKGLVDMASTGNRGGGRQSKGERHFIGSRLPIRYLGQLADRTASMNLTVSEYVERLVIEDLEQNRPDDRQEVLPIQMAS